MVIASIIIGVLVLGVFIFTRVKQVNPLGWKIHSAIHSSDGYAISGYDPAAYSNGGAELGLDSFQYEWGAAIWKFATSENLEAFKRSPEDYLLHFGGYCTFAVSKGFTVKVDPRLGIYMRISFTCLQTKKSKKTG